MKKKLVLLVFVGGALAGGVLGAARYIYKTSPATNTVQSFSSAGGQEGSSSVDLSDDRNLIGLAHKFFVGKVISQGEPRKLSIFTMYPYEVDVILNIKGNLQGTITVYTHGLQPGSTYLMGTRWNENDWGLITSFLDGRELISGDQALTTEQLKPLAENNPRVLALQKAYPNEIPIYSDVKHNTTYNSYKSRHYDVSGALIDDTVVLHQQYLTAHPSASAEPVAPAVESLLPSITPDQSAPADTSSPTPSPAESVSPTPEASVSPSDTPSIVPTETPTDTPAPTDNPSDTPAAS